MSRVVALQFDAVNGAVAADGQSRTDVSDKVAGDDAESLETTENPIAFPCSANPVSLRATGGSGIRGVRVDVAVCPVASATRYVTGVFNPGVAFAKAVNVTTPVEVFTEYEPSPAIVSDVTHVFGVTAVLIKHVLDALKAGPPVVARPPVPVSVVNATDDPGSTSFASAVAVGAGGGVTVGVIVARLRWPSASATAYLIGVAVPVKDGSGSNVTAPDVGLKVYVPWLAIEIELPAVVHDEAKVTVLRQIPEGTAARVVPDPAVSFDIGVKVWLTSQPPVPTSATAFGGGTTVGV